MIGAYRGPWQHAQVERLNGIFGEIAWPIADNTFMEFLADRNERPLKRCFVRIAMTTKCLISLGCNQTNAGSPFVVKRASRTDHLIEVLRLAELYHRC